jgi:AAA+ ATPase superfamily predicted ATPase
VYFDLEPKSRREDLYGFDKELNDLLSLLHAKRGWAPLIVVTGIRRIGKTSLVQTALNEAALPHLILNGRAFADVPTIRKTGLLRRLEDELNVTIEKQKGWGERLLEVLKGVRWVRVNSKFPWVLFEWERRSEELDLLDIVHSFDSLAEKSGTKFILVLDEAQEFRKLRGYSLPSLLAYIYDQVKNVQLIVTGSQVGFLYDFLGLEDPNAPLYGRAVTEIRIPRLKDEQAVDFLTKGFQQAGIKPDRQVLEEAVRRLDGIIGWLTFFGHESVRAGGPSGTVLNEAVRKGSELEAQELKRFLKAREQAAKRYLRILKTAVRLEHARWSDMKETLEALERKRIADNVFNDLLENLVKGSFLEKKEDGTYSVPDPILVHAIQEIRI